MENHWLGRRRTGGVRDKPFEHPQRCEGAVAMTNHRRSHQPDSSWRVPEGNSMALGILGNAIEELY